MAKSDKEDKDKPKVKMNLAQAQERINKEFGDGSIRRGAGGIANVEAWPTGIATLDIAMGAGGIPRGRIIELFGPESSGKTTICLHCIAACQATKFKGGRMGTAAFIDAEHALDPVWARRLGVDWTKLLMSQPNSGEQALSIARILTETGEVDLIVIDSVAALVPQEELDGDLEDHNIGAQARLMSKAMRVLSGECSRTGTSIIFINQIRDKVGVKFGSPETTPGGRALKFYSSMRIDIRRGESIKLGSTKTVGFETTAKIVKNKVGPPFVKAAFDVMFGVHGYEPGVNKLDSLFSTAMLCKVIELRGSTYYYGDLKFSGKEKMFAALRERPELVPQLREQTYKVMLGDPNRQPFLELTDDQVLGMLSDEDKAKAEAEEQGAPAKTDETLQDAARDDD